MGINDRPENLVSLQMDHPIWDRFFYPAPLVIVGTREADGSYDLAPKHMVTPLGWENHLGFVCTPQHATYHNTLREGCFTVTLPKPDAVILTSLSASPRCSDGTKPVLDAFPRFPAVAVDGEFPAEGRVYLGCRLERVVDGFGENSLIAGRIVEAHVAPEALRGEDIDDPTVLASSPLLVYLSPGRFAAVDGGDAFPLPAGFRRRGRET